jgi:glycosyltransferase involved in cell wall biosynthesis
MGTSIIVDPLVNIYYASFYLKGLMEIYGTGSLVFDHASFKNLNFQRSHFNFILKNTDKNLKVSIDFDDPAEINKVCYDWCDIYGKVNTRWSVTSKDNYIKIVALAPGFGIRLWNFNQTIIAAGTNFFRIPKQSDTRKYFGTYKRQLLIRSPYKDYTKISSSNDHLFHLSTLWYSNKENNNDELVNQSRANFILAAKSISDIEFEGGLYYDKKHDLNPKYMSSNKYIEKTKQSFLVFNTPAFWNCHGWKLGEYLALGKAIISTPLSNDLPAYLEHGKNIHFLSGNSIEEIREAILKIHNDKGYKEKLEIGAHEYWEKYGTPRRTIELLGL